MAYNLSTFIGLVDWRLVKILCWTFMYKDKHLLVPEIIVSG